MMRMKSRYRVTREEKYALGTALILFVCIVIVVMASNIGSFMEVRPSEITVILSPNSLSSIVIGEPPPLYPGGVPPNPGETPRRARRIIGIPVPVPLVLEDSVHSPAGISGSSKDSTALQPSTSEGRPFDALDSLILRYPGFRSFALKEQAQRRYPKSKRDSVIAWAKEQFEAQMAKYGKIDPATLNMMAMRQNSIYYGPYHIVAPNVGVAIPFSYTDILQKIRSFFEKEPDE